MGIVVAVVLAVFFVASNLLHCMLRSLPARGLRLHVIWRSRMAFEFPTAVARRPVALLPTDYPVIRPRPLRVALITVI